MTLFDQAFRIAIGEEGGFTANPADPGNWTGGACGKGACHGTKFGIAASAHPELDIVSLSLDQAKQIYQTDYWSRVHGDELPPPLALLVFDAAINCGPARAIHWLQAAVGVAQDGVPGPATMAAVQSHIGGGAGLCAEFQARRLIWMTTLPTWPTFGLGWSRRLCRLPYDAVGMAAA